VREGDPFVANVAGRQIVPGATPVDIKFVLEIIVVPRTPDNPFGLRIINYKNA
jgi:hypothetical protein